MAGWVSGWVAGFGGRDRKITSEKFEKTNHVIMRRQ